MIEPFNNTGKLCSKIKQSKGFEIVDWDDAKGIASKIALIHSELSEALEEVRKSTTTENHLRAFHEELVNVVIRTLEMMYETEADIDYLIANKIEFNKRRPFLHGKKRL